MNTLRTSTISALAVFTGFLPDTASALTVVQVAELFNIFVGLMLTAALLLFFGGLFVYFTRLGTWPNNRDAALKIMEWGVGTLFVLIIILAVVRFFQMYPLIAGTVVGGIVLIAVGYFVFTAMRASAEAKKKPQ